MRHAILTAIGEDRPGLVEEVSHFILRGGGNIEDSRMVNLRGQFALMALIAAPEEAVDSLRQQLKELERQSRLHAELHPADSPPRTSEEGALPYRLSASAIDRQGLVHQIAQLLRERNVNIENLQTRLCPAPITGAPLFDMELILSIPPSAPIGRLRQELGSLCEEANIDWQLEKIH